MGSVEEVLPPFARNRTVHHNANVIQTGTPQFSIVQYNVLFDCTKSDTCYWYCPDQYISRNKQGNSYRHKLLLDELQWLDPDIMCLQEVNLWQFGCLKEELYHRGYSGELAENVCSDIQCHWGIAVFYRNDKFELMQAKKYELGTMLRDKLGSERFASDVPTGLTNSWPQVFQAVALRLKDSDHYLAIGNIHVVYGEWLRTVSQAVQIAMATQAFDAFITSVKEAVGSASVGHVLSGDFNVEPHFPLYHLLSEGRLSHEQVLRLRTVDYIKWSSLTELPPQALSANEEELLKATKSFLTNPFKTLKSAYKCILGKEPEISNHEGNGNFWSLDYIWFSPEALQPLSVLSLVPKSDIDPYGGLPNEGFPSDHLSLKATFGFI